MAKKSQVIRTNKVLADVTKIILTRGGYVDVVFDHIQIKAILNGWRKYELAKKKPDEIVLRTIGPLTTRLEREFSIFITGRGLISKGEVHFLPKYLVELKDDERIDRD